MAHYELAQGLTDEYYTPPEVFKALGTGKFNMDVAAPPDPKAAFVDAEIFLSAMGLETDWIGFVWCNPPYGKRGTKTPWVQKLIDQGTGLLLMPDRTSADWWQLAARHCVDFLTTYNKIKFVGPYGAKPISKKGEPINAPGTGNTIFAFGEMALDALRTGESNNFGMTHRGTPTVILVGVSPSWVDCITISLGRLNGKATLKDIYAAVEDLAPDKVQGNMHWREKVRQKLQDRFIWIEKGVYSKN